MQPVQSLFRAGIQIGHNRARLNEGQKALARAALPFNTKERGIDLDTIGRLAALAQSEGLSPRQVHYLREYLWHAGRRRDGNTEEFVMSFARTRARAMDIVFEQCSSPYVVWAVFGEICAAIARNSGRSTITRDQLAARCRIQPEQVSRHTGQLERTDPPLLRKTNHGRCVEYEVLPPTEYRYAAWKGDLASMVDAAGEEALRQEAERQGELLS